MSQNPSNILSNFQVNLNSVGTTISLYKRVQIPLPIFSSRVLPDPTPLPSFCNKGPSLRSPDCNLPSKKRTFKLQTGKENWRIRKVQRVYFAVFNIILRSILCSGGCLGQVVLQSPERPPGHKPNSCSTSAPRPLGTPGPRTKLIIGWVLWNDPNTFVSGQWGVES